VLGQSELRVREELPDRGQMHVAAQNGDPHRLINGEVLQVLDDDASFMLVVLGCPVVIQVVQNLDAAIDVIEGLAEDARPPQSLDGVHQSRCQAIRLSVESFQCAVGELTYSPATQDGGKQWARQAEQGDVPPVRA